MCCHCSLSRSFPGRVTGVAVAATTLTPFDVAAHALLSGSCHACKTVNWGVSIHMCPDTNSSLKSTLDAATRCVLQRFSFFQGSALSAFPQPTRSGNLGKAGPITSEAMENLWTEPCLLKGPRFAVAQVHLDVRPRRRRRSDKNLFHRQSFAHTVSCGSPARMHLCAVSCTCGLQDAVIALIQPTSILDPSSGVHCFRCPNGKSAGTTHAIKCSTKPVISDKTCRLEPGLLTRKTSRRFWGWACKITKAIDESCNLESGWRQPSFYSHLNCKPAATTEQYEIAAKTELVSLWRSAQQ